MATHDEQARKPSVFFNGNVSPQFVEEFGTPGQCTEEQMKVLPNGSPTDCFKS